MPHKRNPIIAERICGLARVVRAHAQVGFENIGLWHERDISHSSAERVVIGESFALLDYILDRFRWMMEGLQVDTVRMAENLSGQRGLMASQSALLTLARHEIPRDAAYRMVQSAAAQVIDGSAESLQSALEPLMVDAGFSSELRGQVHQALELGERPSGVEIAFGRLDPVSN
jgi:adenylosuccinate lyase